MLLPKSRYPNELDDQVRDISKLVAEGNLTGMSQKLDALFDQTTTSVSASPAIADILQAAAPTEVPGQALRR